jgi:hypothetical protein
VILKVFNCQKWGGKNSKNCRISIFDFQCIAKNIEGWLNSWTMLFWYQVLQIIGGSWYLFFIF